MIQGTNNMKLIMANTSTSDASINASATHRLLEHLIDKLVWFRGRSELGSFHCGYLREVDEAIVFDQGREPSVTKFVYPFWEIMVCEPNK